MTIRFVDLQRQFERHKPELMAAIEGVLSRGEFILGPEVAAFEAAFAAYIGRRHAVAVDSGTSALFLTVRALGLGPGDEVVTVPNTFISTVYAVSASGAKPVLVDVDEKTQLMDVEKLKAALTPRTKAVLPVHLFGQTAPMAAIMAIARARHLKVLEDACQAHGAEQDGRKAGSWGDAAAFSFYPGKNLGAYGDGGMVVTDDPDLCRQLTLLRNYGSPAKYHHSMKGVNARLDTLQAAVLLAKLKHLDGWNDRRRQAAGLYLAGLNGVGDLVLPQEAPGNRSAWHLFVVRTGQRDDLKAFLEEKDIQAIIHYPIPIHLQPAYAELGAGPGSFPVAEKLASEILSLPLHPDITDDEVETVISALRDFFAKKG